MKTITLNLETIEFEKSPREKLLESGFYIFHFKDNDSKDFAFVSKEGLVTKLCSLEELQNIPMSNSIGVFDLENSIKAKQSLDRIVQKIDDKNTVSANETNSSEMVSANFVLELIKLLK